MMSWKKPTGDIWENVATDTAKVGPAMEPSRREFLAGVGAAAVDRAGALQSVCSGSGSALNVARVAVPTSLTHDERKQDLRLE